MTVTDQPVYPPYCREPVPRPLMVHHWERLTFLHWRYDPDDVQRLLPPGLTVETYDGAAWIGLVPFRMRVRPPVAGPVIPWLGRFPETNVRTYAVGPDGTTGVWFFSLEASRLPVVLAARLSYRLPYMWASMRTRLRGDRISYTSRRRWPGPVGAHCRALIEIGEPLDYVTERDNFLTARFALWSPLRRGLARAQAEHPPWPLRHGRVVRLDQNLLQAAGLPAPEGEPLVHYSDGVRVRIGRPVVPD